MGKRNSKLKQDTIDKLIEDTYCKFIKIFKIILYRIIVVIFTTAYFYIIITVFKVIFGFNLNYLI